MLAGVPAAVDVSFEQRDRARAADRRAVRERLDPRRARPRGRRRELKFKDGDALRLLVPCQTTDRLCLFGTNGRAYTLRAGELPRGRGDGQPIRVLAEMTNADDVATLFVWQEATATWSPPPPAAASSWRRRTCCPSARPASRC